MMFLDKLNADFTPSGRWHLKQPLEYQTHGGVFITVPTDYNTNLFSLPKPLRMFFAPNGPSAPAPVVRDFILTDLGESYTDGEADRIFRQALADCGAGFVKRWTLWISVRLASWARRG